MDLFVRLSFVFLIVMPTFPSQAALSYGGNKNIAFVNYPSGHRYDAMATCVDGTVERISPFYGDWDRFCANIKGEIGTVVLCSVQTDFSKTRPELQGFFDFKFTFLVSKNGLYSEYSHGSAANIVYDHTTGNPKYKDSKSLHMKLEHFKGEEDIVYPSRHFVALDGYAISRLRVSLFRFGNHGQKFYDRINVNYGIGGRYGDKNDQGEFATGDCIAIQ